MELKVTLLGKVYEAEIRVGESVLEAVLRHGIEAPYSCMEGVCAACMAFVREGEVDTPEETLLQDNQTKKRRVLTCQARLKSGCSRLAIDYDAV